MNQALITKHLYLIVKNITLILAKIKASLVVATDNIFQQQIVIVICFKAIYVAIVVLTIEYLCRSLNEIKTFYLIILDILFIIQFFTILQQKILIIIIILLRDYNHRLNEKYKFLSMALKRN